MRGILLSSFEGDYESHHYKCPCGEGEVIEEHDNIPGFRSHDVSLHCKKCNENYSFDLSKGVRGWELVKKISVKKG